MTFENLTFWRGVSQKYSLDKPSVNRTRLDRRPKDSDRIFHHIADEWFKSRFGIAFRSQSLHLTSSILTARAHGATPAHVMRIIPISPYKYCWSSKTQDLLFAARRLEKASKEEIESYLDSMEYQTNELEMAHDCGHEVMLHCSQYVAIPFHLLEDKNPVEQPKLILVG